MTQPPDPQQLLDTERELNPEEQSRLRRLGEGAWGQIVRAARHRSRLAYAVADPEQFATCVGDHLSEEDREGLAMADLYNCPVCGLLLKDRGSPVASSILLERRRLAALWAEVESAPDDDSRQQAVNRFRAALGLDLPEQRPKPGSQR